MIYVFDRLDEMSEDDYRRGLEWLPEERQKKARRYLSAPDQYACVVSYLLLRYGLREEYGITEPVLFQYNTYGKPYAQGHEYDPAQPYFNLSHCRCGAACSVSDCETGVDMQDIRRFPIRESLARRVLSPGEYLAWSVSETPDSLFYRYWSIKESYVKQKGTGIRDKMSLLDTEQLVRQPEAYAFYMENERYCLSAFGVKNAELRFVSFAELL